MAIIKEKIPITYFEKMKLAIDAVYPAFFASPTPDVEKLKEAFNNTDFIHSLSRKEQLSLCKSLLVLHGNEIGNQEKLLSHVDEAKKFLQARDNGGANLQGKEASEFLDLMWLSDSPHTYDADKKITTINSYYGRYSIERAYWTFHRFNKYGKKTFRIEEQLTQELFLTDVTNVDSSFLQLPFPCICLYMPFNDKLTIRKEFIRYVYISERVIIGGEKNGSRIIEVVYVSKEEHIGAQQFEISEGKLIEQVEDQVFSLFESQLAIKETNEIISFIMAVLLYTNSIEAVKQNIFPLVFHKRQDSIYPVCSLGYGIKIDKGLHYSQNPETIGLGKPMNVLKWTVRGHFRTYKKGDHWKEDRTIWIRPFLKGRERDNESQVMKPTNYIIE